MDPILPTRIRCNCESQLCQTHEPAVCRNTAYVTAKWIGPICIACATEYPESYLFGWIEELEDME